MQSGNNHLISKHNINLAKVEGHVLLTFPEIRVCSIGYTHK